MSTERWYRRPVTTLAAALLVYGFGQELWSRYMPAYLRVLGATPLFVGAYGTLKDLLDAAYAFPGGILSDRLGSRRALLLFAALTTGGVLLYLAAPTAPVIFVGLLLVMAWPSLGLPATFSLVGEELAAGRRIVGFTVQAVVKRLPILVAPPLGGLLIERFGMLSGVRLGLAVSVALSLGMLAVLGCAFGTRAAGNRARAHERIGEHATLPPALRRLLAADILVRLCEGLPDVFIVVWVLEVVRLPPSAFGLLTSILVGTAILSYIPAVALAGRAEKKWFIVLTYVFFTLFPLAVLGSRSFGALAAAFAVGGLREIGEPSRKAFIVDASAPESRGRAAGLYYAVRGFAVAGAAGIGGLLWTVRPSLTFIVAAGLGAAGTISCALFLPSSASSAGPSPEHRGE